jgi:hypothetical protein
MNTPGGDGQEMYKPSLPADQYTEVTLNQMRIGSGAEETGIILYVRGAVPNIGPAYVLGLYHDPSDLITYYLSAINSSDSAYDHDWVFPLISTGIVGAVPGTKFRLGVVGDYSTGSLYVDVNGKNIFTGALRDSPVYLPSGNVGLQLATVRPTPSTDDISISRWAAGSVSILSVTGNVGQPGILVQIVPIRMITNSTNPQILFAISDAAGNYAFQVSPGSYQITATDPANVYVYSRRATVIVSNAVVPDVNLRATLLNASNASNWI